MSKMHYGSPEIKELRDELKKAMIYKSDLVAAIEEDGFNDHELHLREKDVDDYIAHINIRISVKCHAHNIQADKD